ncbi:oxygen-independent coproporphyrinogen III oxidase [Arsenophonus nasoniae]|nr:oxygen-independent coproporphyrinogen III oxidase [Arsenophonus nasoniae]QBY45008.1 Oxygen-independent coproporphyrinogen-III oxidase [Arsenophonus nasoniae]WGL95261.1 oxygen-independent coproporphyrinogen III oxidase [Arsenophonus nasoniae]WGM02161.1 oxygen-independent coproporphyrinogen III oxidase [Arsenophonus nasoniae]WGM05234.1 oxygen-independent coproporphyrinogen III oxidase [Arsenophonus nasoniae]WGM10244.1 oxygen-independent coproporphyrinogen III oxidase [Arsenophonus nasoniae]
MSEQSIIWDLSLIQKYNYAGPRYTSYPTALEFNHNYSDSDFAIAASRYPDRPLSLYVHIPFCHKLCYFCGCNKLVTRHKHKVDNYLLVLEKEIIKQAQLFTNRTVIQMHWGGGTPTYLDKSQLSQLMAMLKSHFNFAVDAEISIEIDPREIELHIIDHLRCEGFNRLSMGVQDFNKQVQHLVNRQQDEAFIFALVQRAREVGFNSTSIDLIYGLPKQTAETFAFTLERVLALSPDRLSVFNYAHMPHLFAAQRKIKTQDLPTAEQKLAILQQTIFTLTQNGYQFIGMDHFAKPKDELAIAQRNGVLHRNFQGYTTQQNCDLLGLGVSAISMLGDHYAQNQKDLNAYYQAIENHQHAIWKGLSLTQDDCIRRDVIKTLICNFQLVYSDIEQRYQIDFKDYFFADLQLLQPMIADGLVIVGQRELQITAKGRLLIRNICMCFDIYLRNQMRQRQFSRVI